MGCSSLWRCFCFVLFFFWGRRRRDGVPECLGPRACLVESTLPPAPARPGLVFPRTKPLGGSIRAKHSPNSAAIFPGGVKLPKPRNGSLFNFLSRKGEQGVFVCLLGRNLVGKLESRLLGKENRLPASEVCFPLSVCLGFRRNADVYCPMCSE